MDKLSQITITADVSPRDSDGSDHRAVTLRWLVDHDRFDLVWGWFQKCMMYATGLEEGGACCEAHVHSMIDVLERLGMKIIRKEKKK